MARLLSINVGLPRDVAWQGRTVHTGIWKAQVTGPRRVRRLNIDGDGQGDTAGHGGEHRAVFVYQDESYRYWQEHLGRSNLVHGQFGENFTVEGLADTNVCIGDRYRIGSALFEVTQPRVTCYRLGIRMDEPDMAALLVRHGRPGFYFRVLEEGDVEAGDEIKQIAVGHERMSVFEVNALLYLPPVGVFGDVEIFLNEAPRIREEGPVRSVHNPMIPHVVVLEPGLVIHKIYNGYWFFGRPTVEELRQDLRAVGMKCRPDWDIAAPGLRALWDQGRKEHFHPYGKAYVETLGERD